MLSLREKVGWFGEAEARRTDRAESEGTAVNPEGGVRAWREESGPGGWSQEPSGWSQGLEGGVRGPVGGVRSPGCQLQARDDSQASEPNQICLAGFEIVWD